MTQMEIKVWGTRGSYPVCRPDVMKYGGNTTCYSVEVENEILVIDGGSGVVELGQYIINQPPQEKNIKIFLTHPHWDHILGFPFFAPFYNKEFEIDIYGAESENKNIQEIFAFQHQERSFPVRFDALKAHTQIYKLDHESQVHLPLVKISTYQLNHPGVDLGYRFESDSGTFVFLTDLAPIENNYLALGWEEKARDNPKALEDNYINGLVEFVRGADLVIHDTNFTDEEIVNKRHWGHSTPTDAIKLLSHLDFPPALVLAHHDPGHSDDMMDDIYQAAKKVARAQKIELLIAKEGGSFYL